MNGEHLGNLLRKLERRYERLQTASPGNLPAGLDRFLRFLKGNPLLSGMLKDLQRRCPWAKDKSKEIIQQKQSVESYTDDSNSALSLAVLYECVCSEHPDIFSVVAGLYTQHTDCHVLYDEFKARFVAPVYDYLVEHLDDERALLALLRRYKHRCEWFRRDALLALWRSDPGKGERKLTYDLYEYLHDQGLDFAIEPSSASGKPDLISAQVGNEKLIADAKVYKEGTPKSYLATGFHQIYQYMLDYNQPFGYLVIFKTCEDDLKFPMAEQEQSIPFLVHNNKTIFFVVIDICQHEATASKRGILKTVEVTEADLIQKADGIAGTATGAG